MVYGAIVLRSTQPHGEAQGVASRRRYELSSQSIINPLPVFDTMRTGLIWGLNTEEEGMGVKVDDWLACEVELGVPCAVPVGLLRGPLLPATPGLTDTLAGTDIEAVAAGVGGGVTTTSTPEVNSRLDVTPVTFANKKHARLGSIPAQE